MNIDVRCYYRSGHVGGQHDVTWNALYKKLMKVQVLGIVDTSFSGILFCFDLFVFIFYLLIIIYLLL